MGQLKKNLCPYSSLEAKGMELVSKFNMPQALFQHQLLESVGVTYYYANRNLKFQGGMHTHTSICYELFIRNHLLSTNAIVYVIQDA